MTPEAGETLSMILSLQLSVSTGHRLLFNDMTASPALRKVHRFPAVLAQHAAIGTAGQTSYVRCRSIRRDVDGNPSRIGDRRRTARALSRACSVVATNRARALLPFGMQGIVEVFVLVRWCRK